MIFLLFILMFAFIVMVILKVFNLEIMVVTAAYITVLAMFVSNI